MFKVSLLSLAFLCHFWSLSRAEDVSVTDVDASNELEFSEDNQNDTEIIPQARFSFVVNSQMYTVIFKPVNWHGALELCASQNMILAGIRNQNENNQLLELLLQNGILYSGQTFWIGGSELANKGRWSWASGSPFVFYNWRPSEPNNVGDQEHCVELLTTGQWNDQNCERQLNVVCENRCRLDSYSVPIYPTAET